MTEPIVKCLLKSRMFVPILSTLRKWRCPSTAPLPCLLPYPAIPSPPPPPIVSCHFEAFLACTSRPLMWRIRSHSRWRKKLCFSLGVSACRLTYICIYATPSWSILQVRTQKNSRNSLSEFQLKLDFMRGNGCLFCLVPDQANSVRLKWKLRGKVLKVNPC